LYRRVNIFFAFFQRKFLDMNRGKMKRVPTTILGGKKVPELPEVETLCRQLKQVMSGKIITEIRILDPKLGQLENLAGRTLNAPYRTGKGLNLPLDNGKVLRLHLRMTGRLLWQKDQPPLELAYTRFVITFSHGRLALIDPRRFATLALADDTPTPKASFDPLKKFSPRLLWSSVQSKRLPIKSFLLDQRAVSGIGNIYACEILHRASINPWRPTSNLSLTEWRRLTKQAKAILLEAIDCRGTSVSDWRDLFGRQGEYQHSLKVYGQAGETCSRCGGTVTRLKLGGRGTFFCPGCQQ
jgi:formamidopyrimidine-DNA glycosylase